MMIVTTGPTKLANLRRKGFSLIEASVASGVVGIMFAALLSGLTSSVGHVQFGREQNRATQIMMEKLDNLRMYRWDRIVNGSYVATNFTDYFFPTGSLDNRTNSASPGTVYTGNITISDAGMTESYNDKIRKITVRVKWKAGQRPVERQMTTYISKHGLQLYIP